MSHSGANWKAVDPRWAEVDGLIAERLLGEDEALSSCLQASAAAGLPDIAVSAAQGRFLQMLVEMLGAQRVLEIGTLGGFSTIHLARGLFPGGEVQTLEHRADYARVAAHNLRAAGLGDRVEIHVGKALDLLPGLEGPFDLAFIDADKGNNAAYVDHALRMARPGSLIVVDNVVRQGNILDPAPDDDSAIASRALYDHVAQQPRLRGTALQTVGDKGWDGMMLLRVTE